MTAPIDELAPECASTNVSAPVAEPTEVTGPTYEEAVYDQRRAAMAVREVVVELARMCLAQARDLKHLPAADSWQQLNRVNKLARAAKRLAVASYDMDSEPNVYTHVE